MRSSLSLRHAFADEFVLSIISIGGRATVKMGAGDRIRILTPGGGGWGTEGAKKGGKSAFAAEQTFAARGSLEERSAMQLGV